MQTVLKTVQACWHYIGTSTKAPNTWKHIQDCIASSKCLYECSFARYTRFAYHYVGVFVWSCGLGARLGGLGANLGGLGAKLELLGAAKGNLWGILEESWGRVEDPYDAKALSFNV